MIPSYKINSLDVNFGNRKKINGSLMTEERVSGENYKGEKQTTGKDEHTDSLDCGDDFTDLYISKHYKLQLNMCSFL